jgi:hypothetical protein
VILKSSPSVDDEYGPVRAAVNSKMRALITWFQECPSAFANSRPSYSLTSPRFRRYSPSTSPLTQAAQRLPSPRVASAVEMNHRQMLAAGLVVAGRDGDPSMRGGAHGMEQPRRDPIYIRGARIRSGCRPSSPSRSRQSNSRSCLRPQSTYRSCVYISYFPPCAFFDSNDSGSYLNSSISASVLLSLTLLSEPPTRPRAARQ